MTETNFTKCSCQKCGGHIEFPAAAAGSTINCPHCGSQTTLASDSSTSIPPTSTKSKRFLFLISGGVFLTLVLGTLIALQLFRKKQTSIAMPADKPVVQIEAPKKLPQSDIKSDFSIGKISLQKIEGSGLVYAVGTLKNDLDRQRFGVKIELNLIDEQGQNIGSASDYTSVVEAHKEWHFRALLAQPGASQITVDDITEQK